MMTQKPVVTPFGSMPYHDGYVQDKYAYQILAIDRIPREEKETIRAKIKTMVSGEEAATYRQGWTCEILDQLGRVRMLKKNGIEVALFLKRQTVQERPGPGDPVPECALQDPVDVWQRLDVIGPSARKQNFFIKRSTDLLQEKVAVLEAQVKNLRQLADDYEIQANQLQERLDRLNEGKL